MREGDNQPFDKAGTQGMLADLMLCLGSSLRVYTDAMDEMLENGGKLVIVNLQKTPYTDEALQIYAKIDDVMAMLMAKLNLSIPKFKLRRHAKLTLSNRSDRLSVTGIDPDSGDTYSFFKNLSVNGKVSAIAPVSAE